MTLMKKLKDLYENVESEINEWVNKHNNLSCSFYFAFLVMVILFVLATPFWIALFIIGVVCLCFSLPILIPMIVHHKEMCRCIKREARLIINWIIAILFISSVIWLLAAITNA